MKKIRRGATLVEMAIVLAVVGIMLGGAVVPFRVLDEKRHREEEQARLQRAVDAVTGYAIRHRTRKRTVAFEGDLISDNSVEIAAGRPYLPCPDVDGDGFEDRMPESDDGFLQGIEVNPAWDSLTVALEIANGRPRRTSSEPGYGDCRTSRGTLPWRTLGIPPADGWGNRHTYYADPVFASAVFGFDGRSLANIYDSRLPRDYALSPPTRSGGGLVFDAGLAGDNPTDYQCPAVICSGGRANSRDVNACMRAAEDACAWDAAEAGDVVLKAGALAREQITDFSAENLQAGGILEGLPFVIVSHGPNGRGAVNHWASLTSPLNSAGVAGPICNRAPLLGGTLLPGADLLASEGYPGDNHEAINATRYAPGNGAAAADRRCLPFRGVESESDVVGVALHPWVFVWEPQGGDYGPARYDDLLAWMTREELNLALGAGAIPELPPLVIADLTPPAGP